MSQPTQEEAWAEFKEAEFQNWLKMMLPLHLAAFEEHFEELLDGDLRVGEE